MKSHFNYSVSSQFISKGSMANYTTPKVLRGCIFNQGYIFYFQFYINIYTCTYTYFVFIIGIASKHYKPKIRVSLSRKRKGVSTLQGGRCEDLKSAYWVFPIIPY